MVINEYDGVESVSFAAYEAQAERNVRTIKYMVLGWVITVIALCLAMVLCFSEETLTAETTETQTLERVAEADNQGNATVGDGGITIGDSTRTADDSQDNNG